MFDPWLEGKGAKVAALGISFPEAQKAPLRTLLMGVRVMLVIIGPIGQTRTAIERKPVLGNRPTPDGARRVPIFKIVLL